MGEWYLETKIWVLSMLSATELSLFLGGFYGCIPVYLYIIHVAMRLKQA
jgi:hypothetical protein